MESSGDDGMMKSKAHTLKSSFWNGKAVGMGERGEDFALVAPSVFGDCGESGGEPCRRVPVTALSSAEYDITQK